MQPPDHVQGGTFPDRVPDKEDHWKSQPHRRVHPGWDLSVPPPASKEPCVGFLPVPHFLKKYPWVWVKDVRVLWWTADVAQVHSD